MHAGFHALMSLTIGAIIYALTGSHMAAWAFFFGGTFIDLDHVLDSLFIFKKIDLKKIKDIRKFTLHKDKIVMSFHSIELILLIWLVSFNAYTFALGMGMLTHMLSDFYYYKNTKIGRKSLLFLFIIYRWKKKFLTNDLCDVTTDGLTNDFEEKNPVKH